MTNSKYYPITKWIQKINTIVTSKHSYTYLAFNGLQGITNDKIIKILDNSTTNYAYSIVTKDVSEAYSRTVINDELNRINYINREETDKDNVFTRAVNTLKNYVREFNLETFNDLNSIQEAMINNQEKMIEFASVIRLENATAEEIKLLEIEFQDSKIRYYVGSNYQSTLHNFFNKGNIPDQYKYQTNSSELIQHSVFSGTTPIINKYSIFAGVTSHNVPYLFDLELNPTNGNHSLIIGQTGAGKSAATKQCLYQAYKQGTKLIIIDPQSEYKKLTDTMGGIDVEMSSDKGVNIFDFKKYTDMQVMSSILTILIENVSNSTLSEKQKAELTNICHIVKKSKTDTYKTFIKEMSNNKELKVYVTAIEETSITKLLNDKTNKFDLSNQVIRFSFKDLSEAELQIFLMVISQLLGGMMTDIDIPTIVLIDEGFKILSNGSNQNTIVSWLRQLRKFNTSIWLIDQSIREYGDIAKTIFENTRHHLFFNHQPSSAIPLDEETYARVSNLTKYSFLYHTNESQVFLESKIADNLLEYV